MRIATAILGVVIALLGLLWALQGFGLAPGTFMRNNTTWAIIGPIVAVIGASLTFVALRRRKSEPPSRES